MFIHYDVVCGPIGKNPPPGEDFMTILDLDYHLIISVIFKSFNRY